MKKQLAAFVAALALLAAPAFGQSASTIDPALRQAIKELLVQMKYREQIAGKLQQASAAVPQGMLKMLTERVNSNPKLTDDQKKAELAIVTNDIPRIVQASQRFLSDAQLVDDIIDRVVPLYAEQFTLAEVNELVAFYKSPLAAKMQKLLPQLTQEANKATQLLVKERVTALVEQTVQRK